MSAHNQFTLLRERRFGPFFLTQFLGAFNDNVFKNALIIFIVFTAASEGGSTNTLTNLAAGLFILPFFLLSAMAGQIADKFEKSQLVRWVKLAEIVIMAAAAVGFLIESKAFLIGLLFLMGAQSAFFGPVKYGILPQHLTEDELMGGNGMVEMGTFLAILLGTITGGILVGMETLPLLPITGLQLLAITVVAIAGLGYWASRGIPEAPAAAPDLVLNARAEGFRREGNRGLEGLSWLVHPLFETWRNIGFIRQHRVVFLSVVAISWFWFYGATFITQIANYAKLTLGGNESVVTLLLTCFSVGIGGGSLLCEKLSRHRVEVGLIPLGAIGLTIFPIVLYFINPGADAREVVSVSGFLAQVGGWLVAASLVFMGMFGGFYIVPLYTLVLQRSDPEHRSRVIAGNNILNALFMVLSAAVAIIFLGLLNRNIPQLFFLTGVLNAVVASVFFTFAPEVPKRFWAWIRPGPG